MKIKTQNWKLTSHVKNLTFEIFHYCEKLPPSVNVHYHDFYEIYFLLGGNVTFRVEGKTYKLKSGDLLLISPYEMHQTNIVAGEVYERLVLWIDKNYFDQLCEKGVNLKTCFESKADNRIHPDVKSGMLLRELMERLNEEYYSDNEFGKSLYLEGLLYQTLVEVNRLSLKSHESQKQEKPDLISDIMSFINQNYNHQITLEMLEKRFFVSKYYLSHEFTKQNGVSIYKYITLKRLLTAREMMTEGKSPGDIYKLCGFGDYTTFFRAFKAEYGISPKEFMNN